MIKQEQINYITIESVKCDVCYLMVEGYYSRGAWFGKYLKPNEKKICFNCIKDRDGFREEFKRLIGISVERYEKIKYSNEKT